MKRYAMFSAAGALLALLVGLAGLGGSAGAAFPAGDSGPGGALIPAAARFLLGGPGLAPGAYGGGDVAINNWGADRFPNVTQSGSFIWGRGSTVIVSYNSTNDVPRGYTGLARSTDGGLTFREKRPSPFHKDPPYGHGLNYGSPGIVYNVTAQKWYASNLVGACGTAGIGLWSSLDDGRTWQAGVCAHSGNADQYPSHWVDNSPTSPRQGRQYLSWNDMTTANGPLYVSYSDNGTTWLVNPVLVYSGPTLVRNLQISGAADGTVFIAGLDQNNGGASPRTNRIFRSTDGGVNWTSVLTGSTYQAPGDIACNNGGRGITPFWRYMGGGQIGVGPNQGPNPVVHYVYTEGAGGDPGDIYYLRSTDNGASWLAPVRLNTDATTRVQWQPSLSVTAGGSVMVGWYDRRNTANNNYEYWGRRSTDNGATWLADQAISDLVAIPQPQQPDPNVQPCGAETFNYHTANGATHYVTWTDGRNAVGGVQQQDLYFDQVPAGSTATPTVGTPLPTPNVCVGDYQVIQGTGATIVPGTVDIGNHCDDCNTNVTLPFAYTLYDQTFTTVNVGSNGKLEFAGNNEPGGFGNTCLPDGAYTYTIFPHWDDQETYITSTTPGGIFTSISGSAPNRIFNIEWRSNYYNLTTTLNYEARLYESQPRFDLIFGAVPQWGGDATIGVQRDGSRVSQFACNTGGIPAGLRLTYILAAPCSGGSPTPTRTPRPPPTPIPPGTPAPCATRDTGWQECSGMPIPIERGAGAVYEIPTTLAEAPKAPERFHALTRFTELGGQTQGANDQPTPVGDNAYDYQPITNTWVITDAVYTNGLVGDMVVATIDSVTLPGPQIYMIGGGGPGAPSATNMVRIYDPIADTVSVLGVADWWPVANTLPGGGAVANDIIYIFGGLQLNSGPINQIWKFDPAAPSGARWTQVAATLPTPMAYIPAATIGNQVYLAGGSIRDTVSGVFLDSAASYVFTPATSSISPIAPLLVATSHTQAVPIIGFTPAQQEVWVLGGGIAPPGPYNLVQIYNPQTNTWRFGSRFSMPRRDAAIAAADDHEIFIAGGHTPYGPTNRVETYPLPDGSPLPTPTRTALPTPCPLVFSDVDTNNPFYGAIRCLACRGIVSGYGDGTFRWGVSVTRGQLTKIIAGAAGIDEPVPAAQQAFADVPSNNAFWAFIERLYGHGVISGYGCGGPGEPCDAQSRPYFRWGANATRGQIAKITAVAAGITDPIPSTRQTFTDVPPSNPFWLWIEQLAGRNIISGYADGTFRWGNDATRGQMSKIAANAFFPNCATPARR